MATPQMNATPVKLLVVHNSPALLERLRGLLAHATENCFVVQSAPDLKAALAQLNAEAYDAVLLDLDLQGTEGLDGFITLHLQAPSVPVLVFAGTDDGRGLAAVRAGAEDFLSRDELQVPGIARAICYAIERHALRSETHSHTALLQSSEARFRLLINENADAIVVVNDAGLIRFVNPAAAALFGKPREQLIGSAFPASLSQTPLPTLKILRKAEPRSVQLRTVETLWEGEHVFLVTMHDVTAQELVANALRESQERYREFIAQSSDGIWRCRFEPPFSIHLPVDEQVEIILTRSVIEECNMALARMYGFDDPQALLGQFPFQVLLRDAPVDPEEYRAFVRDRYRVTGRESREFDRYGNSKIFIHNIYGIVEHGMLVGMWGTQRDITVERNAQQELAKADALRKHHQQVSLALADSAAALNSTLSFEQVLTRILENVGRVVPHDAASVMLIENETVYFVAGHGFEERGLGNWLKQSRLPLAALQHLAQMRRTGQSVVMPSTRDDSRWVRTQLDWVESYVGAPLCVRDEVIGFLNLDSATPLFFDASHAAVLKVFADQAATALENARLHAQVTRRVEESALVYDLMRELGMQVDVQAMLEMLVTRVVAMMQTACGSLSLYLPETHELESRVTVGEPESLKGTRLKLGEGAVGQAALTREPVLLEDYSVWEHRLAEGVARGISSILSVPMLFGGEVEGVLSVRERVGTVRLFTQQDAQLLTLIATQAAALIHNARLHQETAKHAQQLALVYDAGLTLNRVLEPGVQIGFLTKLAMRSVHADTATFWTYEASGNLLLVQTMFGFERAVLEQANFTVMDVATVPGAAAWAARERVPLFLPDAQADARFKIIDPTLRSGIWVPVEHDGRLLGVLAVMSRQLHAFTPDDERLLVLFASQAAVALENARLYQSVITENERRDILHWASQEVVSAGLDAERVYIAIHQAVARLMPCEAFVISLLSEDGTEIECPYLIDRAGRTPPDTMPCGTGISGYIIDRGEAVYVPDVDKIDIPSVDYGEAEDVSSILGVPMRQGGQVIGALLAESYSKFAYVDSDRVRLEMLAAYAAAALMNVRNYENLRRALVQNSERDKTPL